VHGVGRTPNCSEAVCLAARTLLLADLRPAFLRGVVIFVKYREVSTRTILPNSIDLSAETALYSRFGGHNGGRTPCKFVNVKSFELSESRCPNTWPCATVHTLHVESRGHIRTHRRFHCRSQRPQNLSGGI